MHVGPAAYPQLSRALASEKEGRTRRQIAELFGDFRESAAEPEVIQALMHAAKDDSEADVRAAAIKASHTDPAIRKSAAAALGRIASLPFDILVDAGRSTISSFQP